MQSEAMGKTMAIFMVLAMVMSAIVALSPMSTGAAIENTTQTTPWYVNGTTLKQSPAVGIVGITVTLLNESTNAKLTQTTDSNGKFSFAPATGKGNFTLMFEADGWRHGDVELTYLDFNETTRAATFNSIIMEGREKITGIVKDSASKAGVQGVNVTISTDGTFYYTMTESTGAFSKYVDSTVAIDLSFKKTGYYSNSTQIMALITSETRDIGTVYLETVTPTPTVEVFGWVDSTAASKVEGVLVEVSEDGVRWIGSTTEGTAGYYSFLSYPGRLSIRATHDNHQTFEDWIDVPKTGNVNFDITMVPLASKDFWLNGTVSNNATSIGIGGAKVALYDTAGTFITETTANPSGDYNIQYYDATFRLVVSAHGYFTNTSKTIAKADRSNTGIQYDISLDPVNESKVLEGIVRDSETKQPIVGAKVKVYNAAKLYENETVTSATGYFRFKIFDSSFKLFVDAGNYQSTLVNIADVDVYQRVELNPTKQKDIVKTTYNFINLTTISVTVNKTVYVDNITARVNADREFGMGLLGLTPNNWNIETNVDVIGWRNFLAGKSLYEKDTAEFLTLDNMYFNLTDGTFEVEINNADGAISPANREFYINSSFTYALVGTLDEGDLFHLVLNATYDTETVDYVYDIILPFKEGVTNNPMYEMTHNITETNKVTVVGYNNPITIDPMVNDADSEKVTMTIELSRNGTAAAKIKSGLHYILNNTAENYTAIVRQNVAGSPNTNVTFTAIDSTDPIGDINKANFTWDFGDGTIVYDGDIEIAHDFNTTGLANVQLDIIETGGNGTAIEHSLKVYVDGQKPVAGISAAITDNITFADGAIKTLTVNEDIPIIFSGNRFLGIEGMGAENITGIASYDPKIGTMDGIIDKWYWSWGEEDSFDETITKDGSNNITHTYTRPGTYFLNLTVTDVVGQESDNATWKIIVKDITAPAPAFNIKNAENVVVTEAIEGIEYEYNATISTDNVDDAANLTFSWSFEEEGVDTPYTNKTAVKHTFTKVGMFNVTLFATDKEGNTANTTTLVYSNLGKRPNIRMNINSMKFSADTGTAGKKMTITVNITNDGQLNATGIQTTFYIRNADGTDKEIDTIDTASLAMGETISISADWTPKNKGEYTIWANSTCPDEHSSQWWDNKITDFSESSSQRINVNEAGWVMPVIIVGVIVVIVVVFFGMKYFMKSGTKEDEVGDKRKKR